MARCFGDGDPVYAAYHDDEWGRPVTDERGLFEKVCLEGFQAGLSWRTILIRRDHLRAAFDNFDPDRCAARDEDDAQRALLAEGMLKHIGKIRMVAANARACVALRAEGGLEQLIWSHQPPERPAPASFAEVPAVTPESTTLSKALKRRGFSFVGPTTAYALMQADGLVNDHLAACPVRSAVEKERKAARRNR